MHTEIQHILQMESITSNRPSNQQHHHRRHQDRHQCRVPFLFLFLPCKTQRDRVTINASVTVKWIGWSRRLSLTLRPDYVAAAAAVEWLVGWWWPAIQIQLNYDYDLLWVMMIFSKILIVNIIVLQCQPWTSHRRSSSAAVPCHRSVCRCTLHYYYPTSRRSPPTTWRQTVKLELVISITEEILAPWRRWRDEEKEKDDEFKHLIVKLFVTLKALTLRRLLLTRRRRHRSVGPCKA